MKRDFYDTLLRWKNEDILTPLLVIGARIDKFCKEQFDDYIYISLFDNPEVVKIIKRDINTGYISDMQDSAANVNEAVKIEKLYKNIPPQLAKENKKYQISKVAPNARNRDYRDSMNWLLASKLIVPTYFVNYFETPLKSYMDEDIFKIYLSDTGHI